MVPFWHLKSAWPGSGKEKRDPERWEIWEGDGEFDGIHRRGKKS